jgi:hypothetical protein
MWKLHLLDWFFVIFHTVLMLFNMLGWLFKKTRKWNLLTLLLTAFSWFILGLFYGMGYCILTDWHWDVLRKLSAYPVENSYVQYLFRRLLQIRVSADFADLLTAGVFFVSLVMSVFLNIRDVVLKKKKKSIA